VLEGKSLNMGRRGASSVADFFELCLESQREAKERTETTPQFVIDNPDKFANDAVKEAAKLGLQLDFTLLSLSALDVVIECQRAAFNEAAAVEGEERIQERRAFAALNLGVYLGETIRRTHGGAWEKEAKNPDGASPRLRNRRLLLAPIDTCLNFLWGKPTQAVTRGPATTVQQYYQDSRPMLEDAMTKRLLGTA